MARPIIVKHSAVDCFLCCNTMRLPISALLVASLCSFASGLSMPTPSAARTPGGPKVQYNGGAGIGRLVIDREGIENEWQCHYDMVLVERIQGKPPPESGLFIPQEDLPRLHLAKVVSLGSGREEENGSIAPMPDIKVGDIIVAKNPWGIGPKDEETAIGKKLSFMRSQDIAAVVTGGIVDDEDEVDAEEDS